MSAPQTFVIVGAGLAGAKAAEALRTRDWDGAQREIDRIERETVLATMVPVLRAWLAFGRRQDPFPALAPMEAGPTSGYGTEHRALLELALGPDRTALYRRIDARMERIFAAGLIEETRVLQEHFGDNAFPLRALGYAQAMQVLCDGISPSQAVVNAQAGHRQYAKRQLTWFRNLRRMHWLAGFGDDPAIVEEALATVRAFLPAV